MRAVQVNSLDGPEAVELVDLPEPSPEHPLTPGCGVLVDVHAAGVSFPDVLLTRGQYQVKMEPPFVPGLEVAGVVRATAGETGFSEGDRVVACEEKERLAREAGADEVLRSDGEWRDAARELTGGGVDVVLDPVGGERFKDSLRSLGTGGRLVVVGFTEGSIPEVKVNRLLL